MNSVVKSKRPLNGNSRHFIMPIIRQANCKGLIYTVVHTTQNDVDKGIISFVFDKMDAFQSGVIHSIDYRLQDFRPPVRIISDKGLDITLESRPFERVRKVYVILDGQNGLTLEVTKD